MLIVITKDLSCSHINYEVFKQLNSMVENYNVALTYRNLTSSFYPNKFPLLNYSKIHSSYLNEKDLIIATDLSSALALSNVKNTARKIFYIWELEFLKRKTFLENVNIYNKLKNCTRSETYKQAIENYANVKVDVKDFNLEKLYE